MWRNVRICFGLKARSSMKVLISAVLLIALGFVSQLQGLPPEVCFTQWFDRDNPSGLGDYETLDRLREEYPGKICSNPLSIRARTLSDVPASNTGQGFAYFGTAHGFACVNSQQTDGRCLDYKVRFTCPCPWPPQLVELE